MKEDSHLLLNSRTQTIEWLTADELELIVSALGALSSSTMPLTPPWERAEQLLCKIVRFTRRWAVK